MPDFEDLAPAVMDAPPEYNVLKQRVDLEVNLMQKTVKGSTELTVQPLVRDLKEVRLHCRQAKPTLVQAGGITAKWQHNDPYSRMRMPVRSTVEQHGMLKSRVASSLAPWAQPGLVITLPPKLKIQEIQLDAITAMPTYAAPPGQQKQESDAMVVQDAPTASALQSSTQFAPIKIYIDFEVPEFRDGLHWVGCDDADSRWPYVYTKAELAPGNSSCIFPCVDDETTRCMWEIAITCSKTVGDAFRNSAIEMEVPAQKEPGASKDGEDEYSLPLEEAEAVMELTVLSVGDLVGDVTDSEDATKHTVTFSLTSPVTARHIGFAVGPFEYVDLATFRDADEEERLGRSAIKIDAYCLPGKADEVRNTACPVHMMLDFFGVQFGSFPFSEYQMLFVDDLIYDTVPTAGLTICSADLLFPQTMLEPMNVTTKKLIRAVADQWVGVNVIARGASDAWVVAGVAGFMSDLFVRKLFGNNEYRWSQKLAADKIHELDVERPSLHQLGSLLHLDPAIRDFVDLKSSMVLAILDRRLMKASNSTGVTRIINRIFLNAKIGSLMNGELSTLDFQRTCERLGHSKLEPFFRQWVYGAGCPMFDVKQRFNKKKLVVEMTITQRQTERLTKPPFEPSNFMREIKEHVGEVWAPEVQAVFTGPMTVRIHEADGTPYEHIIDIKEHVTKLEIPYNTKYKRLKRSRRQKERANAKAGEVNAGEGGEDALLYCLGDVLETAKDVEEWNLKDWTPEEEARMGEESYEWIRMDTDFEWIGKIHLTLPLYMYVSQLQQDRDVVAQYESVQYIADCGSYQHSLSILLRTLMDKRYFHGIRTLAANTIAESAKNQLRGVGLFMLEKAFAEMFCLERSVMTRPNDWSDRVNFILQCAIPKAMVKLRDEDGKVPIAVRQFFVDKLKFNDNTTNEFSDAHYIATLMKCLAQSLVISHREQQPTYEFNFGEEEPMMIDDVNPDADFEREAINELERYRRLDEWIATYHNVYSTTAIGCLQMLTKAGIVKDKTKELLSYTRAENADNVRLAAFECLTEIGTTRKMSMMRYLLRSLEESHSPLFRARLLACFGVALGHVALGDDDTGPNGNPAAADGLVVEQAISSEARHLAMTRKTSPEGALIALKLALQGEKVFADALWSAATCETLSLDEVAAIADIAALVFEPKTSLMIMLKLPKNYRASNMGSGKIKFVADGPYRTSPTKPLSFDEFERMQKVGLKYTGAVTTHPKTSQTAALQAQIEELRQKTAARASMGPPATPAPSTPTKQKPGVKLKLGVKRKESSSFTEEPPPKATKLSRQSTPSISAGTSKAARGSPGVGIKNRRSSTPGSTASGGKKAETSRIVTLKLGKIAAARAGAILAKAPAKKSKPGVARNPSVESLSHVGHLAHQAPGDPSSPAAPATSLSGYGASPLPAWNPGAFRSFGPADSAPPVDLAFSPTDVTPSLTNGSIGGFRPLVTDSPQLVSPSEGPHAGAVAGGGPVTQGESMPPPKKKFTLKLGKRPSETA